MKKLLLFPLLAFALQAASVVTLTITVTNTPANDNGLTVNGAGRVWKTTAATNGTEVQIGADVGAGATNLFRHTASYPFSQLVLGFSSSNVITLRGGIDQAVSGSITGNWASLVLSTQTVATLKNVAVPFSAMPTATSATNIASDLVSGLNTYSTNPIISSSTFASQLIGLTNAQTVAGAKSFTNSANVFSGGYNTLNPGLDSELGIPQRTAASGNIGPSIFATNNSSGLMRIWMHDGDVTTLQLQTSVETAAAYVAKTGSVMSAAAILDFGSDTNVATLLLPVVTTNSNPNETTGAIYYNADDEQLYTYSNSEGSFISAYRWLLRLFSDTDSEPSANPTNAVYAWSYGGELKYRTSAASEGAGANNRVHNRADETNGAGSDFPVGSTAYARIDFSTTDPQVTLPTAGTYFWIYTISMDSGASGSGDQYYSKVYNSTDAADVSNSECHLEAPGNNVHVTFKQHGLITVTASKTLQLYIRNSTSARGTVEAAHTKITYIRLN